jgi:uncharacterized protein YcbX
VTAGVVSELWRYPVKSMAGERVRSLRVDGRGAGGDRTHAVTFTDALEAPSLPGWRASYPFAPDAGLDPADPPPAQVTAPDGSQLAWGDPRRRRRLAAELGREVELVRDVEGRQGLRRSLLVTVEASRRALEQERGEPVEIRRLRPNVHLELDAPAWEERGWEGRSLRLEGGVVLEVLRHRSGLGFYARVAVAGRIAIGQSVQLT